MTETTHTVPNGTTYTLHEGVVDEGYPWEKTMWFADNFGRCADTLEELKDELDYWTELWDRQDGPTYGAGAAYSDFDFGEW